MKKICLYISILLGFTCCRTGSLEIEELQYKETKAQREFAKEFTAFYGDVAADVSWMMVTQDEVQADLSNLNSSEDFTIQVFTANPCDHLDFCYLLAEYKGIKGGSAAKLKIDYPTGLNYVYLTAVGKNSSYTGYYSTSAQNHAVTFDAKYPDYNFRQHDAMKYVIGYEGVTDDGYLDFDYNDLVVEIEHVRGLEKGTVRVLAAGCECAAKLSFLQSGKHEDGDAQELFAEVHERMGYKGIFDYMQGQMSYLFLNTGVNSSPLQPSASIDLSQYKEASISEIAPRLIARFTIEGKKNKVINTAISYIPAKLGANYPQAILFADPNWQWPEEGLLISVKHSWFREYLAHPKENPFWYGGEAWKEANDYFNRE